MTRVEVSFEDLGGETRVSVRHWGWDSVPPGHAARHGMAEATFLGRHGAWWELRLTRLKAMIASSASKS